MYKHLLLPTDGSELSMRCALQAVQFAKELGAKITVLYVKPEYPAFYFGEGAAFDPAVLDDFNTLSAQHAEQYTNEIEKLCKEKAVSCAKVSLQHNLIHQAIIDTANEVGADLIVMASHGRGGISALLLGSETQKVLAHSKIPVLVTR